MKFLFNTYKNLNRKATEFLMANPDLYWRSSAALIIISSVLPPIYEEYLSNKTLWDLGAGDQTYRRFFKNSYYSVDITSTRSTVDVIGDIQKLPFKSNSIEALFSAQVLEHVPKPWQAFHQFHRVLIKGGVGVVTVPYLGYLHNEPHDYYRFTGHGLQTLAETAGLSVLEIEKLGGLFCFFAYIRSSLLLPFYMTPFVGRLILEINYLWTRIDIYLDKILLIQKLCPFNYLIVFKKD